MPTAQFDWSLDVECPHCQKDVDLTDDPDGCYSGPIFSNQWDNLKGEEITCPHCKGEFTLDGVEY